MNRDGTHLVSIASPGMTPSTTSVTTADGRTLCVEVAGDPSGFPVLTHHGSPGSRLLLASDVRDAERRGVRLIGYDRPGYGGSTSRPGRTIADCAADVRTIAEALGIERLGVWGMSGGGAHALACAALLPDLVTAVASLAAVAPYGAEGLDYFSGMGEANVEDVELALRDKDAAYAKALADRAAMLAAPPEAMHELFASLLSPVDAEVFTPELSAELNASMHLGLAPGIDGWWDDGEASLADWGFELADISVPVMLWHGHHDRFVPFQHGQWLAARIPGVEAHLSEVDGHVTLGVTRVPEVHAWLVAHA
jgi:pimeloyl-ACP methyl ester carboxylesterase